MVETISEAILEPELPICDPHHHLWDFPASRYLLPELLADLTSGHNVESTVFVECGSFYRASGPEPMTFVGETEFVNGAAAMAASGRYGPVLACEGIVGRADLTQGAAVEALLEAHVRAGNGRFRGVRHAGFNKLPERDRRIDVGGTPRGHPARNSRHTGQQRDHADVGDWIESRDPVQHRNDALARCDCAT